MSQEVHGLAAFYASAPGVVARRMLGAALQRLWPQLRGLEVAGVGWPGSYMGLWPDATRRLALVPRPLATVPPPAPSAVIPEALLPLPDLSMDRILLIHAMEAVPNPEALLRECWRVLRDDGRLIVVLPNRHGAWSLFDHTPFGQGRPWSRGQVRRMLESRLFRVETVRPALFVPPFPWRGMLAGAAVWEGVGRAALPGLSGLVIAEAVKDVLGVVPSAGLEAAMQGARVRVPIQGVQGHGREPHAGV